MTKNAKIHFKIVTCMHAHNHIVISNDWCKYFYSPLRAKEASKFSKIFKPSVLDT